jgi:hypothetical protein
MRTSLHPGHRPEHETNDVLRRELDSERGPKFVDAERVAAIYGCVLCSLLKDLEADIRRQKNARAFTSTL